MKTLTRIKGMRFISLLMAFAMVWNHIMMIPAKHLLRMLLKKSAESAKISNKGAPAWR